MADEQLVAAWLRMLNEERARHGRLFTSKTVIFDIHLAGEQALTVKEIGPVTREHLVARVEQLIQGQVRDRLQGT